MSREFPPPQETNPIFRGICVSDRFGTTCGQTYDLRYYRDYLLIPPRQGETLCVNVFEIGKGGMVANGVYLHRFVPLPESDPKVIIKSFINNEPGSKEEFYQLVRRVTA